MTVQPFKLAGPPPAKKARPKPPKPPSPQLPDVAGDTARRVAVTAPMLLVEPNAVAHSPTIRDFLLPGPVFRYLVLEPTSTVTFPALGAVADVLPFFERDDDWLAPENEKIVPSTATFDPDTEVTFPKAEAAFGGGVKDRPGLLLPVVPRRKLPPPAGPPPRPPLKPLPQLAPLAATSVTVVASRAPLFAFVPVAVMQLPVATAFKLTATVAVIAVLAVMSTVVWPVCWLRTSKVLPDMYAIWPLAAGLCAAGRAGRVAVFDDLVAAKATPPGPAAAMEALAKTSAPRAPRPRLFERRPTFLSVFPPWYAENSRRSFAS